MSSCTLGGGFHLKIATHPTHRQNKSRQEAKLPTVRVRPGHGPPQDVAAPRCHSRRGRRRWHGGLRLFCELQLSTCRTCLRCMPRPNFTLRLRRMNTQYLVSRPMTLVDKLANSMQSCNSEGRVRLEQVKSQVYPFQLLFLFEACATAKAGS